MRNGAATAVTQDLSYSLTTTYFVHKMSNVEANTNNSTSKGTDNAADTNTEQLFTIQPHPAVGYPYFRTLLQN